MTWAKELEELRQREALAEQMGGADKVARQHGRGKMDARARLAALCDEGSFREIGKIAGSAKYDANGDLQSVTPAPFLFGKALINGRPVVATAFPHAVELLASGAGIVVDHDDPDALVSALRRVVSQPHLAASMATEARRLAPRMAWSVVAAEYLRLAHRLIAERSALV